MYQYYTVVKSFIFTRWPNLEMHEIKTAPCKFDKNKHMLRFYLLSFDIKHLLKKDMTLNCIVLHSNISKFAYYAQNLFCTKMNDFTLLFIV